MLMDTMKTHSWDSRRDIIIPGDHLSTIAFCADHTFAIYKQSVQDDGFFAVALSGGSTPKEIYQRLTSPPYSTQIDWKRSIYFGAMSAASLPITPTATMGWQ